MKYFFPSGINDLVLYAPNSTTNFNLIERVRQKLEIIDESM